MVFLVICVEFVAFTTLASQSHGSKPRAKTFSNISEEFGGISLHSYMKQLYSTRAQGNGNGSFTISLGTQKIVATSIRGFEPEKSGKYSENLYILYMFFMQGDLPLSTGCSLSQRFIHDVCSILPNVIRVTPNAI